MKLHKNIAHAIIYSLQSIFEDDRYADKVIEYQLKQNRKWGGRDRRMIAESTYEIVRNYRWLKEISRAKDNNYWTLYGTWLLLNGEEIPEWNEFTHVDADNMQRQIEKLHHIRKVRESVPDWMDHLCEKELGPRWDKELEALNHQASVVLRVNTLKTSKAELRQKLAEKEIETIELSAQPDALVLVQRQNIFKTEFFKEGLFEVQDASSQLVGAYLDVHPGMRVVDACAGAGGKSLHLAALLNNKGKVIALDVEQYKLEELKKRARRAGAFNVETRLVTGSKEIKHLKDSADRLLLDVPCSGMGVLRRNPDAKWKLSLEFIEKVKGLQKKILQDYSGIVKPGGKMVYSTCSILASENREQVDAFLEGNENFKFISDKMVWPSEGFDGFYMCVMERVK